MFFWNVRFAVFPNGSLVLLKPIVTPFLALPFYLYVCSLSRSLCLSVSTPTLGSFGHRLVSIVSFFLFFKIIHLCDWCSLRHRFIAFCLDIYCWILFGFRFFLFFSRTLRSSGCLLNSFSSFTISTHSSKLPFFFSFFKDSLSCIWKILVTCHSGNFKISSLISSVTYWSFKDVVLCLLHVFA